MVEKLGFVFIFLFGAALAGEKQAEDNGFRESGGSSGLERKFEYVDRPSILFTYKKSEYRHQLIYIDTRDEEIENKAIVASKVRQFGENLNNEGLVLMLDGGLKDSRLALADVLKAWGLDPSYYSPSDGPFLIGHVGLSENDTCMPGQVHITDFSGMNTACIKDYINNIEWSIQIDDVGNSTARNRWRERSLICEGSKIAEEGYEDSINKAYQYFKAWFKKSYIKPIENNASRCTPQ